MIRIAIDTCAPVASFAVGNEPSGACLFSKSYPGTLKVADVIFDDLRTSLDVVRANSNGDGEPSIDAIIVTSGPGAFTGQRLGLSLAQGLAAVHSDARLVTPTTLQAAAIAHLATCQDAAPPHLTVIADARRGQVYLQAFDAACRPLDDCVLLDEAGFAAALAHPQTHILALDEVSAEVARAYGPVVAGGQPTSEALVAITDFAACGLAPVDRIRPLYLKPPDAAPAKSAGLRAPG
jgi:tRNA threonylcarbamoyladenosine biosynthesis protein TsaB